jgi:hypothetical protein
MRNHPMHPFAATLLAAALALTVGCTTTNEPAPAEDWFEGGQQKPATAETLQMTARVLASKGNTQQAGFVVDRMYRDFPDNVGTYKDYEVYDSIVFPLYHQIHPAELWRSYYGLV